MRIVGNKSLCMIVLGIFCVVLFALAKSEDDKIDRHNKNFPNKHKNVKLDDVQMKSTKRFSTIGKKLHKKSKRKKHTARKKHNKKLADDPTKVSGTDPPDVLLETHVDATSQDYEITKELANLLPHIAKRKCGHCIWQECPPIDVMRRHCPSGIVRDQCNCCAQCANGVGMPCYLSSLAPLWLPPCGDDLECIPVVDEIDDDLDAWGGRRESEGICYCTDQTPVCGTNNVTYDNICEFREASARANLISDITVKVAHISPCKAGPKIDFKSPDVVEEVGAIVSFRCEISGFPLPRIQWFKSTKIKKIITEVELPGYLSNAVTQVRGGPGKYQLTTWLTLDGVKQSDDGKYICRSTNEYGTADGVASLKIT